MAKTYDRVHFLAKTYDRGGLFGLNSTIGVALFGQKRTIMVAVLAKTYDRDGTFWQKFTMGMAHFGENTR